MSGPIIIGLVVIVVMCVAIIKRQDADIKQVSKRRKK